MWVRFSSIWINKFLCNVSINFVVIVVELKMSEVLSGRVSKHRRDRRVKNSTGTKRAACWGCAWTTTLITAWKFSFWVVFCLFKTLRLASSSYAYPCHHSICVGPLHNVSKPWTFLAVLNFHRNYSADKLFIYYFIIFFISLLAWPRCRY